MGVSAAEFFRFLENEGIGFFTGVPDSLLKEFCACIDLHIPKQRHMIAANEGNAIAIAAGYHLATGKIPLIYMQNSGLGNAVNPLLSLCDPQVYSIPMILLVGWRGEPGVPDAVQHVKDGRIQLELLKAMEIPYAVISADDPAIESKLKEGIRIARSAKCPYVILVKKGTFLPFDEKKTREKTKLLSREQAIEIVLENFTKDEILISTTGEISREVFEIREKNKQPHSRDFLTIGSMGHCSSIALGIALSKPKKNIICLDGDGALIMHMGSLAIIGSHGLRNFKHVVLNNAAHDSVGGQPTVGFDIDICAVAKACGYRLALKAENRNAIQKNIARVKKEKGPALLEIRVSKGSRKNLGRPGLHPQIIKKELMDHLVSRP